MERITNLDEYHRRIIEFVDSRADNAEVVQVFALFEHYDPPFVFQDETKANFNHDIFLECERRNDGN